MFLCEGSGKLHQESPAHNKTREEIREHPQWLRYEDFDIPPQGPAVVLPTAGADDDDDDV